MAWLGEESHSNGGGRRGGRGTRSEFDDRVKTAVFRLRENDAVLADLIDRHGPCTLRPSRPQFPVIVETVISQQLSTKAARAMSVPSRPLRVPPGISPSMDRPDIIHRAAHGRPVARVSAYHNG